MATALFEPGAPDVLYLVDLSSYVLRAYHAIAPLSSPSGEPTHAVHGVVNMLERLFRERRPRWVGIAMDSGRSTFRQEIFPDYKANRPPAPDDLRSQLARCEEIVHSYGLAVFKQPGVEADDLIASAVRRALEQNLRVVIVGADKDLMQLVTPRVVLWDTMRDRVFGPDEVMERFGVPPAQLGDLLALMGDSSDNIPGVPSVGPKTARDLLVEYGSIDGIYAHLDSISRKKLRETLAAHEEQARISRKLVELKSDCPVDLGPERLRFGQKDRDRLESLYRELGFQRQLVQLQKERDAEASAAASAGTSTESSAGSAGAPSPEVVVEAAARAEGTPPVVTQETPAAPEAPTEVLTTLDALRAFWQRLAPESEVAVEPFTTHLDLHRGPLVGIALAAPGQVAYVPFGHRHLGAPPQISAADFCRAFDGLLRSAPRPLVAYDSKRARVLLEEAGVRALPNFAYDVLLSSYLIDPERAHGLESLVLQIGGTLPDYDGLVRLGRRRLDWDELDVAEAARYAGSRAHAVLRLVPAQRTELEDLGLRDLLERTELPLARQLAAMERTGVLVDTTRLGELSEQISTELAQLEKQAHAIAGREFNVNAPRQLETLLFDELKLKPLKRTKTSRSTDAATLEALADEHELPAVILQIRQLSKLKGTYVDALPQLVDPRTGRVHGAWEQAVAATGRISSTEPNLQNIPIRTALGRTIREAFVAPPGYAIVSADYSQIELRVLAHLSGDERLVEAFRTGQDIHTRTAMEIFDLEESEVTREHRTRAKAVNFGVIYGQGESGLSKSLGISREEAGRFIAAYFRRYEGVRRFMDSTLEAARAGEAVRSLLGRRRLLPDIRSGNRARRFAAERIAMNMPIQGSAADLLKLAMLALSTPATPGTRMVLTVHDELVFEVPLDEVPEATRVIREKMENVYPLSVPLVVDVGHGPNWNAAH